MSDHQESRPADLADRVKAMAGGVTLAEVEANVARVCDAIRKTAWKIGDAYKRVEWPEHHQSRP